VGEPLRLENLLALQQALGIGPKALDEVFARRQLGEARSQTSEDGAGLGPAGRRELEQPLSPGDSTVHMHKAGFGAHGGRRQTCQERLLELSRDAPAGRQKPLECRVMLLIVLEHASGSVGDIVDAGAAQASFLQ
jgi:hypothetical protein